MNADDATCGGNAAAATPRGACGGAPGPGDIQNPMTIAPYAVIVEGLLTAEHWQAWFEGVALSAVDGGKTQLVGDFDQPALHGLLARIRDLGLVLVAVRRLTAPDGVTSGARS